MINMSKVINEFHINKMTVLILDNIPNKPYSQYRIEGKNYKPIPVYDAKNCIAINENKNFIGQTVEFID
jgi:hypothetical protein